MVAVFVVLTVIACIAIDALVQVYYTKYRDSSSVAIGTASANTHAVPKITLEKAPEGAFLDAGHTYLTLEKGGVTRIGADSFALAALGNVDQIDLPQVGREIRRGEKLFSLRQGHRSAVFRSPVEGIIVSVNETLLKHPEVMKRQTYDLGWVCQIQPKHLAKDLKHLVVAEEGAGFFERELEHLAYLLTQRPLKHATLGAVLQDGGSPADGSLAHMDDETWSAFAREFLGGEES